MKLLPIIALITALFLSFSTQASLAKDKSYKFNYKMSQAKEISDETDLKLLRAAEYSLKKGYGYFVIDSSRTYDKAAQQKTVKFGQRRSKRPQIRTELVIHCYDAKPEQDGAYSAKDIKLEIDQKYGK